MKILMCFAAGTPAGIVYGHIFLTVSALTQENIESACQEISRRNDGAAIAIVSITTLEED